MNRQNGTFCRFHPRQKIVGVCPFCLNEKLLVLASNHNFRHTKSTSQPSQSHTKLSKIFTFTSFLTFRHRKCADHDGSDYQASTSQEDSFISINFEDNGAASWEKGKGTVSTVSLEHCNLSWNHSIREPKHNSKEAKSIVELSQPRAPLRWKKRLRQLSELMRWKRSKKTKVCHGGSNIDSVKARKGWIRTLTSRRT